MVAGKAQETCCTNLAAHPQTPAYRGSQGVVGVVAGKETQPGSVGAEEGQIGPSSFCRPDWATQKSDLGKTLLGTHTTANAQVFDSLVIL